MMLPLALVMLRVEDGIATVVITRDWGDGRGEEKEEEDRDEEEEDEVDEESLRGTDVVEC